MRCAHCGVLVDPEDNFCRRCGAALNGRGLPTFVSRSLLPVPWDVARGPVLRGAAALAVGTLLELARREVARRAPLPDPSPGLEALIAAPQPMSRRGRFPWSRAPKGEYEVTETVIQRRIRFFRR